MYCFPCAFTSWALTITDLPMCMECFARYQKHKLSSICFMRGVNLSLAFPWTQFCFHSQGCTLSYTSSDCPVSLCRGAVAWCLIHDLTVMSCCAGALFVANHRSDLTSLSISMDIEVFMGIWAMAAVTKSLPHLQQLSIDPLTEQPVLPEGGDMQFSLFPIEP